MGRLFLFTKIFSVFLIALFFPIFISGNLHLDFKRKKYAFCLKLYEKIRIFGGYATLYGDGIALHVSDKRAILMPYKELNSKRKKFSFVKTFKLVSTKTNFEVPLEGGIPLNLFLFIFDIAKQFDYRLNKCDFQVWISEKDNLKISAKCTLFFNIFILLIDLLEFLWGKINGLWQEKAKKSTI